MKQITGAFAAAAVTLTAAGWSTGALAADVEAAKALAQQNGCMQCHSLRSDKDASSFLKIAEKYKGQADAVDELVRHMTTGAEVKLPDGTKEKHKVAVTMPPNDAAQLKNLAQYILSVRPRPR